MVPIRGYSFRIWIMNPTLRKIPFEFCRLEEERQQVPVASLISMQNPMRHHAFPPTVWAAKSKSSCSCSETARVRWIRITSNPKESAWLCANSSTLVKYSLHLNALITVERECRRSTKVSRSNTCGFHVIGVVLPSAIVQFVGVQSHLLLTSFGSMKRTWLAKVAEQTSNRLGTRLSFKVFGMPSVTSLRIPRLLSPFGTNAQSQMNERTWNKVGNDKIEPTLELHNRSSWWSKWCVATGSSTTHHFVPSTHVVAIIKK